MSTRTATIADNTVLLSYDACVDTSDDKISMKIKSWTFQASHDKILDSREMNELTNRLNRCFADNIDSSTISDDDHVCVNGYKLRLPAMIFGRNIIKIMYQHPTNEPHHIHPIPNIIISLNAEDALKAWIARHRSSYLAAHPWTATQVPMATRWNARNDSDIRATRDNIVLADILAWDWTFLTDYCGSLHISSTSSSTSTSSSSSSDQTSSAVGFDHDDEVLCARSMKDTSRIHIISASGLDMALLQDRSQPILFYDEAILYQDDLEDCGEIEVSYKIRVMPTCWLLLLRCFLRVDHVMICIRESRYFHKFGDDGIYLDVIWQEINFPPSLPSSSTSSSPATSSKSSSSSLSSSSEYDMLCQRIERDAKLQRDANLLSRMLPVVNDSEDVPKHYHIPLSSS